MKTRMFHFVKGYVPDHFFVGGKRHSLESEARSSVKCLFFFSLQIKQKRYKILMSELLRCSLDGSAALKQT